MFRRQFLVLFGSSTRRWVGTANSGLPNGQHRVPVRGVHVDPDPVYHGSPENGSGVAATSTQGFASFDSESWWRADGPFSALHSMNAVRVPWIVQTLHYQSRNGASKTRTEKLIQKVLQTQESPPPGAYRPLDGLKILDVGCGGGILTEPLARLGASVTGVDESPEAVEVARTHADEQELAIDYITGDVADLDPREEDPTEKFDAIVASELVEHVQDKMALFQACAAQLRPGGHLFITTINRTELARILAIGIAEKILRLLPNGIHDWDLFVSPEDLEIILRESGFRTRSVHGLAYNPIWNEWSWSGWALINYAVHAVKI